MIMSHRSICSLVPDPSSRPTSPSQATQATILTHGCCARLFPSPLAIPRSKACRSSKPSALSKVLSVYDWVWPDSSLGDLVFVAHLQSPVTASIPYSVYSSPLFVIDWNAMGPWLKIVARLSNPVTFGVYHMQSLLKAS